MTDTPASTTTPSAGRRPLPVAAVQMVSTPDVAANLDAAARLIARAADDGARLVALPEYFCLLGRRDSDKLAIRERDGDGPIQAFLAECARRHRVWVLGGTVPLDSGSPTRVRNASLLYGPDGTRSARYDKIHLFGFERGAERFDESATIAAGRTPVVADVEGWRLGLSICYDLRFPELYRNLAPVDLILVPSAFTYTTGQAHWDLLLRARAIENQCYVLAPAQGGEHPNGRRTWGRSMLVDPWGEVVSRIDEGEGLAAGVVDPGRIDDVRRSLPALTHRVM
ncbi:MAG: carbon-nitrogen hydrolase family protein [Burkholderiaceae bacterium]